MILNIKADHVSVIYRKDREYTLVIINMVGDVPDYYSRYDKIEIEDCAGNFTSNHTNFLITNTMDTTRWHPNIKRITHINYHTY